MGSYAHSKLANVLFTMELQRQLKEKGRNIKVFSLHPGVVATELARYRSNLIPYPVQLILRQLLKTPEEGAQTTIFCATAPEAEPNGGKVFDNLC
jgi:retinol dehydrogenase-12